MSNTDISLRQQQILVAIVEQYADVGSPVGSVALAQIFGVSSATIRSEMAALEEMGYIRQPHTSAGRVPTDKGYRFFVNQISHEFQPGDNEDDNRSLGAIRLRIESAGTGERMIKNAVDTLVGLTGNLGLATIGNQIYLSGMSKLFGQPEFSNADSALSVARLLDNLEPWLRETHPNQPLSVYIGQENPIGGNSGCSLIVSRFRSPYSDYSYVGVIGSTRQSYRQVMGLVENTGRILEKVVN